MKFHGLLAEDGSLQGRRKWDVRAWVWGHLNTQDPQNLGGWIVDFHKDYTNVMGYYGILTSRPKENAWGVGSGSALPGSIP